MTPGPQVLPPQAIPDAPRGRPAPANSSSVKLVFQGIALTGAEAIAPAELSKIWAAYIGQEISIAQLYEFANKITRQYVDAGYALSFAFVPEQEIDDTGIVKVVVIEGFVEDVVLGGDLTAENRAWMEGESPLPHTLGELANNIMLSRPLRSVDLEKYLLLINDHPGLTARAVFVPSEETRGASRLVLEVKRRAVTAQATVNNQLSPSLLYHSFGATGSVHGVFTGADSLSIGAKCGTRCNAYKFVSAGYTTMFGARGAKGSFSATHSNTAPQKGTLNLLSFEGVDTTVTFDASYPLIRSRSENMSLGGKLSWSDGTTSTFAGDLTSDSTRILSAYLNYDFADKNFAVTSSSLSLTQGLPLFGATEDDDPLRSRVDGSAVFTNANLSVSHTRPLGPLGAYLGTFSLFTSVEAQGALGGALLSSSQCYYGGASAGRGYNSGAIGGDHCVTGISELRHDWRREKWGFQAYGFGDFGAVWRIGNNLPAGEEPNASAASVGLGLRSSYDSKVELDFMIAMPLDKEYAYKNSTSPRFLFSLIARY